MKAVVRSLRTATRLPRVSSYEYLVAEHWSQKDTAVAGAISLA